MSERPSTPPSIIANDEGRTAFFAGILFSANPYGSLDVDVAGNATSWAEGWLAGRNDGLLAVDTESDGNVAGPVDAEPDLVADGLLAEPEESPDLSPVAGGASVEARGDGATEATAPQAASPGFTVDEEEAADADQAPGTEAPPVDADPVGEGMKMKRTLVEHGVRFAIQAPNETGFFVTLTTVGLGEDGEREIIDRATTAIEAMTHAAGGGRGAPHDSDFEDALAEEEALPNPFYASKTWAVVEFRDGSQVISGHAIGSWDAVFDVIVPETTYRRGPYAGRTFPAFAVRLNRESVSRIWAVSEEVARALRVVWERPNLTPWGTPASALADLVAALTPAEAPSPSTPS